MINTKAFLQIASDTGRIDEATRSAVQHGAVLPRVQERRHAAGFRTAELMRSLYGWYIRSGSGLEDGIFFRPSGRVSSAM